MYYFLVILATVLLAFDFAISKRYQQLQGTSMAAGLTYAALNGAFTCVIFFALSGFRVEFSWFSLVMGLAMAACGTAYSIIGFRVLKLGGMAIYSVFLMSGGMLLPYAFGVLFLDETVSVLQVLGVAAILAGVILSGERKKGLKASFYVLCAVVFLLNGGVSIISKCHQIGTAYGPVDSTGFVMYSGVCKLAISLVALLFCPKGEGKTMPKWSICLLIMGAALIGGVSYMLQLIGARELPATVLYPICTGGSIIFSAIAGRVFYKEKVTRRQLLSIGLCFLGTLLFL